MMFTRTVFILKLVAVNLSHTKWMHSIPTNRPIAFSLYLPQIYLLYEIFILLGLIEFEFYFRLNPKH